MIKYRPEVDGLRALAVTSVVLYHAAFSTGDGSIWLSGGYLGVDVFFVISGYLITLIVLREIDVGGFSLQSFYRRRIRRIIPALLCVLAATTLASWFVLTPKAMYELSQSVVATLLFSQNILLWLQDGYWAEPSQLKPLLHTWSLAVEEQFYLLFPLLLMLLAKYQKRFIHWYVYVLLGLSFLLSLVYIDLDPEGNFYLLPTRAWEILIGACCAFGEMRRRAGAGPGVSELLAGLGLAAILFSFFCFNSGTPHPYFPTLLPIIGSALVIWHSRGTWTQTALSLRPVVYMGNISYSLYLWHWPVIVLLKIELGELSLAHKLFAVSLSVVLAIISYHWIEQPFRRHQSADERPAWYSWFTLKQGALVGSLCLCLTIFSASSLLTEGYKSRVGGIELSASFEESKRRADCLFDNPDAGFSGCLLGARKADAVSFAVIGDSHAFAMLDSFDRAAESLGRSGLFFSRSGCPPLIGSLARRGKYTEGCKNLALESVEILQEKSVDVVYLVGFWTYYTEEKYGYQETDLAERKSSHKEGSAAAFISGLSSYTEALSDAGIKAVIIHQVPGQKASPEGLYAGAAERIEKGTLPSESGVTEWIAKFSMPRAEFEGFYSATKHLLETSVPAMYESVNSALCDDAICWVGNQDMSYYSDTNHLSAGGNVAIQEEVERLLQSYAGPRVQAGAILSSSP